MSKKDCLIQVFFKNLNITGTKNNIISKRIIWWKDTNSGSRLKKIAITATSYIPPGQYESSKVKKFLSIIKLATKAAITPKNTSKKVAIKL